MRVLQHIRGYIGSEMLTASISPVTRCGRRYDGRSLQPVPAGGRVFCPHNFKPFLKQAQKDSRNGLMARVHPLRADLAIHPSGIGPRVVEPALMLNDPGPWSAPLEEMRLKES